MTSPLPPLADITRLSPRVIRILGGNPGPFTLQGTNTYLVGQGRARILIDTGEGRPAWTSALAKCLSDESATVDTVILTHWHPDHVGGVSDLLALCPDAKVYKHLPDIVSGAVPSAPPPSSVAKDRAAYLPISPDHRFTTDGATLHPLPTPGHTVDHLALLLDDERALFTADAVLGHGTAVFEDLTTYMSSLQRMLDAYPASAGAADAEPRRAYPGHGDVLADGPAAVREYIAHRLERERQALDVLRAPAPDGKEAWESMAMVKVIYAAYPENLHAPAEGSLLQVLKKLEGEGRVKRAEDGRWGLTDKAAL